MGPCACLPARARAIWSACALEGVEDESNHGRAQEGDDQGPEEPVRAARVEVSGGDEAAEEPAQDADENVGDAAVRSAPVDDCPGQRAGKEADHDPTSDAHVRHGRSSSRRRSGAVARSDDTEPFAAPARGLKRDPFRGLCAANYGNLPRRPVTGSADTNNEADRAPTSALAEESRRKPVGSSDQARWNNHDGQEAELP